MKLRTIKRRHDARTVWAALVLASYENFYSDSFWHEDEPWDEEDYAGCTACASCGAGVNPHDEDECWLCGAEI